MRLRQRRLTVFSITSSVACAVVTCLTYIQFRVFNQVIIAPHFSAEILLYMMAASFAIRRLISTLSTKLRVAMGPIYLTLSTTFNVTWLILIESGTTTSRPTTFVCLVLVLNPNYVLLIIRKRILNGVLCGRC